MTETLDSKRGGTEFGVVTVGSSGVDGEFDVGLSTRSVYRLRDLSARARLVALAFVVALVLPPLVAFVSAVPNYAPAGDVALMGLRALDVGTSATPLTGQPSLSALYAQVDRVDHLGPTHFYLLAGPVRIFGGNIGMPLVSVLIVASAVLIAAWAVFRQLGALAAMIAAVMLGAIMYSTGAGSLINPVSSNIAGYPLLCSAVLLWCLLCGDLRLLPLAAGVVSFTAQQHLSVLPAAIVLFAGGIGGLFWWLVRHGRWRSPGVRREVRRWGGWALVVAFILWSPVLIDQIVADGGNLGRLVTYTSSDKTTLGAASGLRQVTHIFGFPPVLGRWDLTVRALLEPVSWVTGISAAVVAAVVVLLGIRWRRAQPRRAALTVMVGITAAAGLVSGSAVPQGREIERLVFYHWIFVLSLFIGLVLGLGVADLVQRARLVSPRLATRGFVALALVAIAVPAIANPHLDRPNRTPKPFQVTRSEFIDPLADAVVDHQPAITTPTMVIHRNFPSRSSFMYALELALTERGINVTAPVALDGFVSDDRLVDPETVRSGLVLVTDTANGTLPPASDTLLAEVTIVPGYDAEAMDTLMDQASTGGPLKLGPDATRALTAIDKPLFPNFFAYAPFSEQIAKLAAEPKRLRNSAVLEFLRDHPIESPQLDPALIDRILTSFPGDWNPLTPLRVRLYLLNRDELNAFLRRHEL